MTEVSKKILFQDRKIVQNIMKAQLEVSGGNIITSFGAQ